MTVHRPTVPLVQSASSQRRTLSLTSLVVVPLKQHLGCCVIVPTILKVAGTTGVIGGLFAASGYAHLYFSLALAPLLVWACLYFETRFHAWQHRRGHFHAGKFQHHKPDDETDCETCLPCPVGHSRRGVRQRYLVNLLVAYGVIGLIELFHTHLP